MTTILNASTSAGLIITPDTSGNIQLQYNGVAAPIFSAYTDSSSQSITTNTWTKINFNNEEFDSNNNFASSRFTPTVAGYYEINAEISYGNTASTGESLCAIYKNGTRFKDGFGSPFTNILGSYCGAYAIIYMNGTTDYVEAYTFQDTGGTRSVNVGDAARTYFQGFLLRGA